MRRDGGRCAAAGRLLSSNARVCLVDGNVRSSRLSTMLSVDERTRLVRRGAAPSELCLQVGPNLYLARLCDIPAGEVELPPVNEMRRFFAGLEEKFDHVLIDAPEASSTGDALVLSTLANGSVLVVEANRTRKMKAHAAKEKLDAAGVRLLGTVLDNRTFPIPESLYRLF